MRLFTTLTLVFMMAFTSAAPALTISGAAIESWRDIGKAISGSYDRVLNRLSRAPNEPPVHKTFSVRVNDNQLTSAEERMFSDAAKAIEDDDKALIGTAGREDMKRWSTKEINSLSKYHNFTATQRARLKAGKPISVKVILKIGVKRRSALAKARRDVAGRGRTISRLSDGRVFVTDTSNGGSRTWGSDGSCSGQCGDN